MEYGCNHCCYYGEPGCYHDIYSYSNKRQWLYQNGYGYRDGESAAKCNGNSKSRVDLLGPEQHHYCYWRRHLPVEHGRHYGYHFGKPNNDNHLHGNSNRHERLYENGYGYSDCKSNAFCNSGCYPCHYLCRPEQHPECYGRWYLCLEYRRFDGFYYS